MCVYIHIHIYTQLFKNSHIDYASVDVYFSPKNHFTPIPPWKIIFFPLPQFCVSFPMFIYTLRLSLSISLIFSFLLFLLNFSLLLYLIYTPSKKTNCHRPANLTPPPHLVFFQYNFVYVHKQSLFLIEMETRRTPPPLHQQIHNWHVYVQLICHSCQLIPNWVAEGPSSMQNTFPQPTSPCSCSCALHRRTTSWGGGGFNVRLSSSQNHLLHYMYIYKYRIWRQWWWWWGGGVTEKLCLNGQSIEEKKPSFIRVESKSTKMCLKKQFPHFLRKICTSRLSGSGKKRQDSVRIQSPQDQVTYFRIVVSVGEMLQICYCMSVYKVSRSLKMKTIIFDTQF